MLYQICILMVQAGRHFNLGDNFLYSYNLCVDLVAILYGEMRCWLLQRAFFNRGGGGGDSHMKQTGMLVVSLRAVNFGFWSRLGCSGQNANILSRQGLV